MRAWPLFQLISIQPSPNVLVLENGKLVVVVIIAMFLAKSTCPPTPLVNLDRNVAPNLAHQTANEVGGQNYSTIKQGQPELWPWDFMAKKP